ncbi:MAG: hypothetical protein HYW78_04150 [Parcubacteria group bacterium]|nr:hypothetical protein [Parcubacteria group bacterium]
MDSKNYKIISDNFEEKEDSATEELIALVDRYSTERRFAQMTAMYDIVKSAHIKTIIQWILYNGDLPREMPSYFVYYLKINEAEAKQLAAKILFVLRKDFEKWLPECKQLIKEWLPEDEIRKMLEEEKQAIANYQQSTINYQQANEERGPTQTETETNADGRRESASLDEELNALLEETLQETQINADKKNADLRGQEETRIYADKENDEERPQQSALVSVPSSQRESASLERMTNEFGDFLDENEIKEIEKQKEEVGALSKIKIVPLQITQEMNDKFNLSLSVDAVQKYAAIIESYLGGARDAIALKDAIERSLANDGKKTSPEKITEIILFLKSKKIGSKAVSEYQPSVATVSAIPLMRETVVVSPPREKEEETQINADKEDADQRGQEETRINADRKDADLRGREGVIMREPPENLPIGEPISFERIKHDEPEVAQPQETIKQETVPTSAFAKEEGFGEAKSASIQDFGEVKQEKTIQVASDNESSKEIVVEAKIAPPQKYGMTSESSFAKASGDKSRDDLEYKKCLFEHGPFICEMQKLSLPALNGAMQETLIAPPLSEIRPPKSDLRNPTSDIRSDEASIQRQAVKSAQETISDADIDVRPKVAEIKVKTKIYGIAEELSSITLADIRKYANFDEATSKILDKINLLGEDSLEKKAKGIQAFKQSPFYQMYLAIMNESFANLKSPQDIIKGKEAAGAQTLTYDEFRSIVALNKKLKL